MIVFCKLFLFKEKFQGEADTAETRLPDVAYSWSCNSPEFQLPGVATPRCRLNVCHTKKQFENSAVSMTLWSHDSLVWVTPGSQFLPNSMSLSLSKNEIGPFCRLHSVAFTESISNLNNSMKTLLKSKNCSREPLIGLGKEYLLHSNINGNASMTLIITKNVLPVI